jgi:RNA polymerase sigma-70 factor (ECF subfamily)
MTGELRSMTNQNPQAAFVEHLTGCQRRLFAYIFSLVPRAADADDILQETNVLLWKEADKFQPGTDFGSWACQVAYFQVLSYRKRVGRSREYFDDELIRQLSREGEQRWGVFESRQAALRKCVSKLRPEHQALLAERYRAGDPVKKVAARLHRSPAAVSEALRRIRKSLLRCIERRLAAEAQG